MGTKGEGCADTAFKRISFVRGCWDSVFRMTKHVIPGTDISMFTNSKMRFNLTTDTMVKYEIKNSKVTASRKYANGAALPDNRIVFCHTENVGDMKPYTYNNLITLYFENIGSIGNRQVGCTISITKLEKIHTTNVTSSSGAVYPQGDFFYIGKSGLGFNSNSSARRETAVFHFYYMDTKETVDKPLTFFGVDIDSYSTWPSSWAPEAITFGTGFSNDYYCYSACNLEVSGNRFVANRNNATLYPGSNISGANQYLIAGVMGVSKNGDFTVISEGRACGTPILIGSPYLAANDPVKTVDSEEKMVGDTAEWNTSFTLHKRWVNSIFNYESFSITDSLPMKLEYQSAKVLKDGVDITDKGTLAYDSNTRKVAFTAGSELLTTDSFYDGGTITLQVSTVITGTDIEGNVTNKASVFIDGVEYKTEKNLRPKYQITTTIRHQDINGNWSEPIVADTQTKEVNDSYSYLWERNKVMEEPEAVYKNGDPVRVGISSVYGNETFQIDVARKQYTYTFNHNLPAGHTLNEVTNPQPNLENCFAETDSGNVLNPSLPGYTFLGWKDASGKAYQAEPMLSDKTFTASWSANKYMISYDGNGSYNPEHEDGEQTQNQVTTVSGMVDSSYTYDVNGTLRTNDFKRAGYTFTGWDTKPDGTGTAYPDGYNKVLNLTDTDGGHITLYAQWKKALGKETLTVRSEETGNPIPGINFHLDGETYTTDKNGQVIIPDLHWKTYELQCTQVPDGYELLTPTSYTITYDQLEHTDEKTLYLKRVSLILDSEVSGHIEGEQHPAFLYHITGTDAAGVSHTYDLLVQTKDGKGSNQKTGLYAGTYEVTQTSVSRYHPEPAEAVQNADVNGIHGTAKLIDSTISELKFPYTLSKWDGSGSVDKKVNQFQK